MIYPTTNGVIFYASIHESTFFWHTNFPNLATKALSLSIFHFQRRYYCSQHSVSFYRLVICNAWN